MNEIYDPFELSKKKDDGPTAGRLATGALFGPIHGAVAGKKGHKLKAAGYELAGGVVAGPAGAGAGTYYAHKAGHLKPQKKKVEKGLGMSMSAFGVEHEDIEKGLAGTRPLAVGATRFGRGVRQAASQVRGREFTAGAKTFGQQTKKAGQTAGVGVKQMGSQAKSGLSNMSFGHKMLLAGAGTATAAGVGTYAGRKTFGKSAFFEEPIEKGFGLGAFGRSSKTVRAASGVKALEAGKGKDTFSVAGSLAKPRAQRPKGGFVPAKVDRAAVQNRLKQNGPTAWHIRQSHGL